MKIDSQQPQSRAIETLGTAIKNKLSIRWRNKANNINAWLASVPAWRLRVLLLLFSAFFGICCLGLLTGFL